MYVDESGSELLSDKSPWYVTSGVIFHEDDLSSMKGSVQNYKNNNFVGKLKGAEIHLHDMFNCQNRFEDMSQQEKWSLIDNLYQTVSALPMTIISSCINKYKFIRKYGSLEDKIIDYCYVMLVERFQMFLQDNNNKGIMRIDKTTDKKQFKLNKKDERIIININKIRRHSSGRLQAVSIVEEPLIIDSILRKGLQLADSVAYCTTKFLNNRTGFTHCWDLLLPKIRSNSDGKIEGYGLIIYPQ